MNERQVAVSGSGRVKFVEGLLGLVGSGKAPGAAGVLVAMVSEDVLSWIIGAGAAG
jgi:DNA helicase TIP49 (TBP-interacting protein)